jgi:short subunit dehydrogenase-like uncharacterized protein
MMALDDAAGPHEKSSGVSGARIWLATAHTAGTAGMAGAIRFGIVGGCGATGRMAVRELWTSGGGEILVGGRDHARASALAAEFDGRVAAAQVDVLDAGSLERFCAGCSVIVNCGGPVLQLQDRVAQVAFRARCHYVDVAGLSFVKEGMASHGQEIADLGLSFVVSAGWIPGISELLPVYAHARAREQMEAVESVTVYFGDSGAWSDSGFEDMAWYFRRTGLHRPSYYRKGERVRAGLRQASAKVDLGGRVGLRRFSQFCTPELDAMGRRLNDCDVFTYSYVPGMRTVLAVAVVALLPLPRGLAVRMLRNSFPKDHLSVGGFVVVRVLGSSQGRRGVFAVRLVYDRHRDYWMNGLVVARVARMVAEGKGVQPGVHFLADAVDPVALMTELRQAGVEQSEDFEPLA